MRKNIWLWGGYITLAILFTFVLSHLIYHGYHHTLNSFKALFQATSAPPATLQSFMGLVPLPMYAGVGSLVSIYFGFVAYRANRSLGSLNRGQHGTARWATRDEIQKQYDSVPMKSSNDYDADPGVVISMERKAGKVYIDNSPANNLVIGTTRSGKGETFIFPTIDTLSRAKDKPSLIINDPKGEFVASASETLQNRGYRIEVLNISDPTNSMRYNPLKLILDAYKRGAIDEAELLCDTLTYSIYQDEGGSGSDGTFFADSSKALTNAIILAIVAECVEKGEEEKATLYTVASFMTEYSVMKPGTDSAMDKYFDSLPPGNPAKNQYAQLRMSEGKTRASILSNTMSKLTQFTLTNIAQMTATQDFDMTSVGFPSLNQYAIEAVFTIQGRDVRSKTDHHRRYSKQEAQQTLHRLSENKPQIEIQEKHKREPVEPLYDLHSLQNDLYRHHDITPERVIEILDNLLSQGFITDYRGTSRYYHTVSKVPLLQRALALCSDYQENYLLGLQESAKAIQLDPKDNYNEDLFFPKHLVRYSETPAKILLPVKAPNQQLLPDEYLVLNMIINRFLDSFIPTPAQIVQQITTHHLIRHQVQWQGVITNPIQVRYEAVQIERDQPVAIFMVTPDYDKSKHFLASTFVRQLYYVLAKTATFHPKRKCDRQVHFILDEFGSMPVIESMDSIITVCLSRNIRFTLVVQSYQQLEDRYKSIGAVIKENCSNTIYILSSDYTTCDDISRKCGDYTMVDYSRSGSHMSLSKNESEQARSRRLILVDDLLRMPIHQSIVLRATKRTDRTGRPIENVPIFNRDALELVPRWKYLMDIFPDGKDSAVLTRERYRKNRVVDLKALHFELPLQFTNRMARVDEDESSRATLLKVEIDKTYGRILPIQQRNFSRPIEAGYVERKA